jgi:hypothetical protein
MLAPEIRKALLSRGINAKLAHGARLLRQGEFSAVLVRGRVPHFPVFAALALFAGPLALLVICVLWSLRERRELISIDDLGLVRTEPV